MWLGYTPLPMIVKQAHFTYSRCYQSQYDSASLQAVLQDPDRMMAEYAVERYKDDDTDTSSVARVQYEGLDLVIKRYNLKHLAHRLKRGILKTKARVSWDNALLLQQLAIPSLLPVACIEKRWGPWKRESYLITEYQEGMLAHQYFAEDSPFSDHFQQAIHNVSTLVKRLKQARIAHDDFQLLNILMVDDRPVLLDLDHMHCYGPAQNAFAKAHQKDLDRLFKDLHHTPVIHRMFKAALQP